MEIKYWKGTLLFQEKTEEALVDYVIDRIENKFNLEEKYQKRIDSDFNLRDNKNCERIYKEILRVKK